MVQNLHILNSALPGPAGHPGYEQYVVDVGPVASQPAEHPCCVWNCCSKLLRLVWCQVTVGSTSNDRTCCCCSAHEILMLLVCVTTMTKFFQPVQPEQGAIVKTPGTPFGMVHMSFNFKSSAPQTTRLAQCDVQGGTVLKSACQVCNAGGCLASALSIAAARDLRGKLIEADEYWQAV